MARMIGLSLCWLAPTAIVYLFVNSEICCKETKDPAASVNKSQYSNAHSIAIKSASYALDMIALFIHHLLLHAMHK